MDRLKLLVSCVGCALGPVLSSADAAPAKEEMLPNLAQWQSIITDAAQQFSIPDTWIRRVMRAESGGRTHLNGRPITSSKGAMGLMQIMPSTYRTMRIQYGLGDDAYDPRDNIFAGAAYLRQMYDRYGYPSLFAAYNAGPKRLDDFLLHGQSLPRETLDYVASIVPGGEMALSNNAGASPVSASTPPADSQIAQHLASGTALFFTRNDAVSAGETVPATAHSGSPAAPFSSTNDAALFVPLAASSR
jgi:Transglycosylase SLT domain